MQNNSYESSKGTFSTSNEDEAYQVPPVQRVIQKPQEERESPTKRSRFTSRNYRGTLLKLRHRLKNLTRTESKCEMHSLLFKRTSHLLSERSEEPLQLPRHSQSPNGGIYSKEKPLTLMSSSAVSTTLPLLRRMWDTLEVQRSLLESQIWFKRCK
jgi:hypothetical protein